MSLSKILLDIGTNLGLSLEDPDELAFHIKEINAVAEELYRKEIPGSLREQIFKIDDSNDTFQVSFPYYVGKIRGVRNYNRQGFQINLQTMAPRYAKGRWGNEKPLLNFRVKETSPISRKIDNTGIVTFTLARAETVEVQINVVGSTDFSDSFEELLTIPAGQLSAVTTEQYNDFEVIEKRDYNTYNITITSIDGTVLGTIPNRLLAPKYQIIQIINDGYTGRFFQSTPFNLIEVLYKQAFTPFVNLYDNFPAPNCDDLIFWAYIARYAGFKPGLESKAVLANAMVEKLLTELHDDDLVGKTLEVNMDANRMYDAYNSGYYWSENEHYYMNGVLEDSDFNHHC